MAKYSFTKKQFEEIKSLLRSRLTESRDQQKKSRAKIRKLGFNILDHFKGFTDDDFQGLLNSHIIEIIETEVSIKPNKGQTEKREIKSIPSDSRKKSLPPVVDSESLVIVLGTMPGEQSLIHQEYYNNPNNHFWQIILSIFNNGEYINEYDDRIELLKKYNVGLWDVLMTCERKGSKDSQISNPIVNDFDSFFSNFPKIKRIIFNGKDSFHYYRTLIKNDFDKTFIQLNSTSSSNTHKTIEQKIEEWGKELKKLCTME